MYPADYSQVLQSVLDRIESTSQTPEDLEFCKNFSLLADLFKSYVENRRQNHPRAFRITMHNASPKWSEINKWQDLEPYINDFELAVLPEKLLSLLGIKETSFCVHDPRSIVPIEASGFRIDLTCNTKKKRNQSSRVIHTSENIDAIWKERFQGYALYSASVAVFDTYAGRNTSRDGLFNLLERLISQGWQNAYQLQTIDVYTTYDARRTSSNANQLTRTKSDISTFLRKFPRGQGQIELKVHLHPYDPPLGLSYPHPRWLRFGENIVTLDKGLVAFHSIRTEDVDFQLKFLDDYWKELGEVIALSWQEREEQLAARQDGDTVQWP